jgi:RNA polymerase sigma factor (sigma-70 family)
VSGDLAIGPYLDRIGRLPLLTAEEEQDLARRIETDSHEDGPKAAREHLFLANTRLVVSIAKRYPRPPGVELMDLIQAGNVGLQRAVDGFDWRRGVRFSTYATRWIHQAVGRAVDRSAPGGHIPLERRQQLRAGLRFHEDPSDLPAHLQRAAKARDLISLDSTGADGAFHNKPHQNSDDVEFIVLRSIDFGSIREAVSGLPSQQERAVTLRFGLDGGPGRAYSEIADDLGVSVKIVPLVMKSALATLRDHASLARAAED